MDILDRIHELLDEKFYGKPELLAECMGESEAAVSRWLFGVNDFTADFSKVAYYFEEPVIAVASTDEGGGFNTFDHLLGKGMSGCLLPGTIY